VGNNENENNRQLKIFLSKSTVKVLNAGIDTAEYFAKIKIDLKKKGTPIPINDVWIAAHVRESGSELITNDRHFERVSGLKMWNHST